MTNAPDIQHDLDAVIELLRAGRAGMALVVAERLREALPELLASHDHELLERCRQELRPARPGSDRGRLQELCATADGRRLACRVLQLGEEDLAPLLDGRADLARTSWRKLWAHAAPRVPTRR